MPQKSDPFIFNPGARVILVSNPEAFYPYLSQHNSKAIAGSIQVIQSVSVDRPFLGTRIGKFGCAERVYGAGRVSYFFYVPGYEVISVPMAASVIDMEATMQFHPESFEANLKIPAKEDTAMQHGFGSDSDTEDCRDVAARIEREKAENNQEKLPTLDIDINEGNAEAIRSYLDARYPKKPEPKPSKQMTHLVTLTILNSEDRNDLCKILSVAGYYPSLQIKKHGSKTSYDVVVYEDTEGKA